MTYNQFSKWLEDNNLLNLYNSVFDLSGMMVFTVKNEKGKYFVFSVK